MRKRRWLLFILILLILIQSCSISTASSADGIAAASAWTMFRHDLDRSGFSTVKSLTDIPKSLWTFETWKAVKSSPAVANGSLVVGSRDWRIYCLDSLSGRHLWNYSTGNEVNSSPAIYNGLVYVGSDDGYVYCVDIAKGTLVWKSELGGLVRSSPAIANGAVYIGSGHNSVFCLNSSNGAVLKRYQTSSRVHSSPAVVDALIYVATDDFHVYAFDASSGSEMWRRHTGSVFSSPCVFAGRVYIGSNDGYICCLNASTGTEIWKYQTSGSVFSSPAAAYGFVYVGCDDNNVYCLNASNGDRIWQSPTGYWVRSSPAIADGRVYVGSEDFNIYCFDAFTGEKRWSYSTGSSVDVSPVLANGILYVGSSDHRIYAFALSDATAEALPPVLVDSVPWTTIVFDVVALVVAVMAALTILWLARTSKIKKQQTKAETSPKPRFTWASSHADALCVFLLLLFSAAFFVNLGNSPLWVTEEQTYSQWAFHMFKTGDYLSPWSFGQLDFGIGKPPLFAWLVSLAYQIFGVTNFAARFWSAVFGSLSLVVIFFLGKKLYNRYVGLLSALVLGTFTTFYVLSTRAMTDAPLIFFILCSLYSLLLSDEKEGRRRYTVLSGLFFGFAFMTKQAMALLIPVIILVYFTVAGKGFRYLFTKRFALFWQVAILMVAPWIIYMLLWFGPDFWNFHFVFQGVARTVSSIEEHGGNYLYYFSYLVDRENILWVILLPFAAGLSAFKAVVRRSKEDTLVFSWMSIVLVFFTFTQTKQFWYILPAFPAFAIAIGSLLFQMLTKVPDVLGSPPENEGKGPRGNFVSNRLHLQPITRRLKEHFAIIGVLLGAAFLLLSLGPFSSWDSQVEFSAAMGIIQWGMPYTSYGNMINMQPLGFYIAAFFLRTFGSSYTIGVAAAAIFALGSVFVMYKVGEALYGSRTGLLAAALFALAPWQLIMSRAFLVDVYCLFFSLLCLLVSIYALRKDSLKLFLLAGLVFGLALLAKLFAVFILIPLALIFLYSRPKSLKRSTVELALFILPASLLQYFWYEAISGRGLMSMFGHDDFGTFLPVGLKASPFFNLSFLVESLGVFFILGCFLSLLVSFIYGRRFSKLFFLDLTCFVTVAGVMGLNLVLVFYGNLLVPYVNSIKYNFLTLPLLCLLGASAVEKCIMVSRTGNGSPKRRKLAFYVAWVALYLILVSMASNFLALTDLAQHEWVSFKLPGDLSYSFNRFTPVLSGGYVWAAQALGFILILLGLVWANRDRLLQLIKSF